MIDIWTKSNNYYIDYQVMDQLYLLVMHMPVAMHARVLPVDE